MDYTVSLIMISTALLSVCSGLLGSFLLLRKQSLLADTISHCALAGITGTCLVMQEYNPWALLVGATFSSGLSMLCIQTITHQTMHKQDTALGIILSSFFGLGLVCMTIIQKQGVAHQALLHKFLFGNVATLLHQDLYLIGTLAGAACIICVLFWKEFTLISFDPLYAATHTRMRAIEIILITLSLITIIIGISVVGVILMSSLLIAPAAAARQWTRRIHTMALLAILFALSATSIGIFASSTIRNLPTGPAIVIVMSVYVMISLVLPRRR
jgi:manganese/zinc/iron transport system permease protein